MRAIMVMFDSLNRRLLPPFGAEQVVAPNFERLAEQTTTFDNCYAGSMPCMPARRELHTGRHNFLHRSWGPLEPFDDSMPQLLGEAGVHTHLATDHQHYWEDGGGTYHPRYSTFEFFRGQEGDPWKGHVGRVGDMPPHNPVNFLTRQDSINRQYLRDEADHPQTQTFDAGLHFLETNVDEQNWFVQIETFDPHEPFFSYEHYRTLYGREGAEGDWDWPAYRRAIESAEDIENVRAEYFSLVTMCDRSLGRVLDFMDTHEMWDDTMLIVCTDHGFLLGEHGWMGKSVMPWYDETIHTPLFIWDPRSRVAGARADALVQTIDLPATLLALFNQPIPADMLGHDLGPVIAQNNAVRSGALFGQHGSHVSVTDGRYVYMRASIRDDNGPLFEYTLMPTHMRSRFFPEELRSATLHEPFSFTKQAPVLRVPAVAGGTPADFGTLLFDLATDPEQDRPLRDDELELHMVELLVGLLRENDAPAEQYERLGLPANGRPGPEHLLIARQWDRVVAGQQPGLRLADVDEHAIIRTWTIESLFAHPATGPIIEQSFPAITAAAGRRFFGALTPLEIASVSPRYTADKVLTLEHALSTALSRPVAPIGT